jgi:hypothetical protein
MSLLDNTNKVPNVVHKPGVCGGGRVEEGVNGAAGGGGGASPEVCKQEGILHVR